MQWFDKCMQVRRRGLGSACANPKDLLAFYVWLGWMYLMAMINDALFAIFLKFLDDHRVATSLREALPAAPSQVRSEDWGRGKHALEPMVQLAVQLALSAVAFLANGSGGLILVGAERRSLTRQ
jgi:hypothetical protein